jgi:hypothetical protein
VKLDQPAISSIVRPQPRQRRVLGSRVQILTQGVSIAGGIRTGGIIGEQDNRKATKGNVAF